MGDGRVERHAIIINGDSSDTRKDALEEQRQVEETLRNLGFGPAVVSVNDERKSGVLLPRHSFYAASEEEFDQAITDLEEDADDDDELLLVVTSHGFNKSIALDDGNLTAENFGLRRFAELPCKQKTVVISTCYSGSWANVFKGENTLFIASASANEVGFFSFLLDLFQPEGLKFSRDGTLLPAPSKIPDLDGNKWISWRERFSYAVNNFYEGASAVFVKGQKYEDHGLTFEPARPPFSRTVHEVTSPAGLKALLKKLKPADVAVVQVTNLEISEDDLASFEVLADEDGGDSFFIRIANGDDPKWSSLGVGSFPSVLIFDHLMRQTEVSNMEDPLSERYKIAEAKLSIGRNEAMAAIRKNCLMIGQVSDEFAKDADFVIAAAKINAEIIEYIDDEFFEDGNFVARLKQIGPKAKKHTDKKMRELFEEVDEEEVSEEDDKAAP